MPTLVLPPLQVPIAFYAHPPSQLFSSQLYSEDVLGFELPAAADVAGST